jgi:hypothetical protein
LVGEASGLRLERFEDAGEPFYAALTEDGRRVGLYLNSFDDELVDGYSLDIDVDGKDEDGRIAYARSLFDALATRGVAVLLTTEDLIELDRFEPKPAAAE